MIEVQAKIYRCTLCAWDYLEEEEFLLRGLSWEALPLNWQCPNCGGGKQDFEVLEEVC